MQLVLNPRRFDVLVTENMFGDILSDEGAVLAGSIGMLPSASLGDASHRRMGGTCTSRCTARRPTSRDKNKANPFGAIGSVAAMLEYSFGLKEEAAAVNRAVETVLEFGPGHRGFETSRKARDDIGSGGRCSAAQYEDRAPSSKKSGTTTSWPSSPARRRCLYVDLHLVHEVTSPQAFAGLRQRGLKVRRPDHTIATADHSTPTTPRSLPILDKVAAAQVRPARNQLPRNSAFAASA